MSGALDGLGGAVHEAGRWAGGVAREIGSAPWPVPAAVVLAGLAVLLFGARPRRPVAALGAAGVAAAAAGWLGAPIAASTGLSLSTLAVTFAALAGAVAALVPPVFPALAGALPGALLAGLFAPADRFLEVLLVGAALGAVAGFLLARLVASAVAASVGALAVALGAAGALPATSPGRALLAHPVAILAIAVVLAVAGAAFQLSRAWGRGAPGSAGKREPPRRPSGEAPEPG